MSDNLQMTQEGRKYMAAQKAKSEGKPEYKDCSTCATDCDWPDGYNCQKYTQKPSEVTISYPEGAKSSIKWNHIDGPMFCGKDGYVHWLTLLERLMFRIGAMTIADLERKYNHNDQRG